MTSPDQITPLSNSSPCYFSFEKEHELAKERTSKIAKIATAALLAVALTMLIAIPVTAALCPFIVPVALAVSSVASIIIAAFTNPDDTIDLDQLNTRKQSECFDSIPLTSSSCTLLQESEEVTDTEITGFHNFGNNCYFNAAMKCLFSDPKIGDHLEKELQKKSAWNYVNPTGVVEAKPAESDESFRDRKSLQASFKTLYQAYRENKFDDAKNAIRQIFEEPIIKRKNLSWETQDDPQAVITCIYESLEIENDPSRSITLQRQDNRTGAFKDAGNPETYQHLELLPINQRVGNTETADIQDYINSITKTHELNKTDDAGNFTLQAKVKSILKHSNPENLHQLSFLLPSATDDNTRYIIRKIEKDIILPIEDRNGAIHNIKLSPKSFICHHGTRFGGHYWAFVKHQDNWYRHDDIRITKVENLESAFQEIAENATIAFYEKAHAPLLLTDA